MIGMSIDIPYAARIRAQHHAMELYPSPSFGVISGGNYVPGTVATLEEAVQFAQQSGAEAVIYSKPDKMPVPEEAEMKLQAEAGIAFGVMGGTPQTFEPPFMWGDTLEVAALIGRPFIHGIWDCYSLVRDAFAAGREGMAAQGMTLWPHPPVSMPNVARSDAWWDNGQDLYMNWLKPAGFVEIPGEAARPGDGFLMKIRSKVLNHAGVLVEDNAILHHLPTRLSRRENAGVWFRQVEMWVRYQG